MANPYRSAPDVPLMEEVTEDFVQSFLRTTDFSGGFFGFMHYARELPGGVDAADPRVKAILERLDEFYEHRAYA